MKTNLLHLLVLIFVGLSPMSAWAYDPNELPSYIGTTCDSWAGPKRLHYCPFDNRSYISGRANCGHFVTPGEPNPTRGERYIFCDSRFANDPAGCKNDQAPNTLTCYGLIHGVPAPGAIYEFAPSGQGQLE